MQKKTDFPDARIMEQFRRIGLVGGFGLVACFAFLLVGLVAVSIWIAIS